MEEINKTDSNASECDTKREKTFFGELSTMQQGTEYIQTVSDSNKSQDILSDSPIYELEEEMPNDLMQEMSSGANIQLEKTTTSVPEIIDQSLAIVIKRKLTEDSDAGKTKIVKLEIPIENTQSLDEEVSKITANVIKRKLKHEKVALPFATREKTPVQSSPRKITKRSNSDDVVNPKPVRKLKSRPASADITTGHKTSQKYQINKEYDDYFKKNIPNILISENCNSRLSVEFVREVRPPVTKCESISEECGIELADSQNFQLILSPVTDSNSHDEDKVKEIISISEPTFVNDREEIIVPGRIHQPHSEGYNYSDQSSNLSQGIKVDSKGKTTDQDTTDSVSSINMDSPDNMPTVTSKLISKLSNGDSSTPTDKAPQKHVTITISDNESDNTPDMAKIINIKGKRGKSDSFRVSNNTTPSTISPLPNGHTMPLNTPQIPVFDIHLNHNEDGEFLSVYIVRTDNDIGMDMGREFQKFSKRFTIDPYLADVSSSTSPSSVTSMGMLNLPNRTSFTSTTSSSTVNSNRTCDGAFVVPQPPRKSFANVGSVTIKGHEALMKKLHEIFSHVQDSSAEDSNRSTNSEKNSIGVQASPSNTNDTNTVSNGNASPEEVAKCDKVTPKSSLKKTRVRGRRPLTGKTKRAILPTQTEEPEYMHGMNSPEIVSINGEGKDSLMKSPVKDAITGTPKSVSKLKLKRSRPTSPRPPTPVEKFPLKTEFPGYAPDTVVLAKWVDKRYYSGRVLEIIEPNKYLIKFDDSQTKVLLDDFIIFGNMKTLPLQGQSVYAMVDDEQNYEPGLVMGVETNNSGTVVYRCTTDGDTTVCVTASELYLTEDQARSIKDSIRPKSPSSMPSTPRRRGLRELDLDNIIQGPRSARSRDKVNSSTRKRIDSPKSPKASTSGVTTKVAAVARKRLASESSELSESSNSAPPVRLEEVAGVEPEVQRTPRKIDGVKAGPLQLKGAAKRTVGKKNSKLAKFDDDDDTVSILGPIPPPGSKIFAGMHFLLTCADSPRKANADKRNDIEASAGKKLDKQSSAGKRTDKESGTAEKTDKQTESSHYSSEEDNGASSNATATDCEEVEFSDRPFNKERLKEQLEAGAGTVYSDFDDVPKNKYSVCKLIAPRPCTTAKYLQCLAADIRALCHAWVIVCCIKNELVDTDAYALPAGWDLPKIHYINWIPPNGKRNTTFFKDKLILLCGDQDTFVKFWERICTLAGANTRVVNEEELHMTGGLALVTDWDCPHEVQNKANQDNIPLVHTAWVIQCLIEGKVLSPTSHHKFSFMYAEPE